MTASSTVRVLAGRASRRHLDQQIYSSLSGIKGACRSNLSHVEVFHSKANGMLFRRLTSNAHYLVSHHRFNFVHGQHLRLLSSESVVSKDNTSSEGEDTASSSANAVLSSPKLQGLYDRIAQLPSDDVNILGALIIQMLGRTIFPGEFGGGGGGAPGGAGAAAGGEETAPVEEAKTIFDLKLVGFDAKAKIKVIKEVRAIAGLGLKEAKELVESAPKVIQKDLKQDKADELKVQLEAIGAEIEIV